MKGTVFIDLDAANAWRPHHERILRLRDAGNLAIIVGSGVSQFAPSNVPVAATVTWRLHRLLLRTIPRAERGRVARLTRDVPFEVLIGRLRELDEDWATDVVRSLVSTSAPNSVHRLLIAYAGAARNAGTTCPIVTTNYDQGLHLAALKARVDIHEIVAGSEPAASHRPEILYVHGYIDRPTTLVLDFRSEFAISGNRIRHLRRLVTGRELLIVGFSGGDLDVSDALADAGPSGCTWIRTMPETCEPERWHRSARQLLERVPPGHRTVVACRGRLGEIFDPSGPDAMPDADHRSTAGLSTRFVWVERGQPYQHTKERASGRAGWPSRTGVASLAPVTTELAARCLSEEG